MMIPYLVAFFLTTVFAYIAGRCRGSLAVFFFVLTLLPLCILAGFRDLSVGTDTSGYGHFMYAQALDLSLRDYIGFYPSESLYAVFVWVVSNVFKSEQAYFFIVQLLISACIFSAAFRASDRYAWIGILAYCLLFYTFSLNLMRQVVAVSIVVFAYRYIERQKPLVFVALCALAAGCHQTALLGILVYPLTALQYRFDIGSLRRNSFFIRALLLVFVLLVAAFVGMNLELLAGMKESYSYQVSNKGKTSIDKMQIFLFVLMFVPVFLLSRLRKKGPSNCADGGEPLGFVLFSGMVLYHLIYVSPELFRISLYFLMFLPAYLPRAFSSATPTLERDLLGMLFSFSALYYWYYFFMFWNSGGTYPYSSVLLGI